MSKEDKNKANVRRLIEEAYGKGNMSVLSEIFAPEYVLHSASGDIKSPEGMKKNMELYRKALPDMYVKPGQMVAEGDYVAGVITYGGTFKGELMGFSPTGKKINITALVLSRHGKDGRQLEAWSFVDMLDWYRQLGIPIPPG